MANDRSIAMISAKAVTGMLEGTDSQCVLFLQPFLYLAGGGHRQATIVQ
jgi:hypothetical protein